VGADFATLEEVTIAFPFSISQVCSVGVVLTIDPDGEGFKVKAIPFLSVTLGFLDLSDHS